MHLQAEGGKKFSFSIVFHIRVIYSIQEYKNVCTKKFKNNILPKLKIGKIKFKNEERR